ncbi:hypothetical protein ACIPLC_34885 [Kitasatospora sp. NPDC086801]|uniref:hypothetical protein n=1 Tax=Kitasatospora sp. NPDC086801 TaxID=3364066 RepID=UPI00381DB7E4
MSVRSWALSVCPTRCGARSNHRTSPLGARWAKVMVARTRVTGWILWSLLAHRDPPAEP